MSTVKKATTTVSKKKGSKVGLSAPWTRYAKLIYNLFEKDPSIEVTRDNEESSGIFNIYIKSPEATKLAAIKKILGESIEMGNITIQINYEDTSENATLEDYREAFKDTGYLVACESLETPIGNYDCPIFAKEIIQFFNDDTSDIYGNCNIIVADAVKEVSTSKAPNLLISTSNGTEENK